jgi:hypothetical protein
MVMEAARFKGSSMPWLMMCEWASSKPGGCLDVRFFGSDPTLFCLTYWFDNLWEKGGCFDQGCSASSRSSSAVPLVSGHACLWAWITKLWTPTA